MRKRQKGSFTIEAAMLIPMILFLIATMITILFYWHDRTVLKGLVYETAVIGAERAAATGELETYANELLEGKLLWFPTATVTVEKEENQVVVKAEASRRRMKAMAQMAMPITAPEKIIRRKEYIDEDLLQK